MTHSRLEHLENIPVYDDEFERLFDLVSAFFEFLLSNSDSARTQGKKIQ